MKKIQLKPDQLVLLIVSILFIIGIIIVPDIGESWDENLYQWYGGLSLSFYSDIPSAFTASIGDFGHSYLQYYGPIHSMAAILAQNIFAKIPSSLQSIDIFHMFNFATFLLGLAIFYRLCKYYMSEWAAFSVTLLLATQPVLFGHAFMNSKDIPFMTFFIAAIYTGLRMIENYKEENPNSPANPRSTQTIQKSWMQLPPKESKRFKSLIKYWFLLILTYFIIKLTLSPLLAKLISTAYYADPASFLGSLFSKVAQNADQFPVETYQAKANILLTSIFFTLPLLALPFIPTLMLLKSPIPKYNFSLPQFKYVFSLNQFGKDLKNPNIIIAGILVGLTTSIRILGPAAGALISLFFILKYKGKSLSPIISYALISALTTYLTWPFLWAAPISRFFESINVLLNHPWRGRVLFEGQLFNSGELPVSYLPKLLSLQLTEPALILAVLGLILSFIPVKNKTISVPHYSILLLWIFPILYYVVLTTPVIYDNFRQFFFILPPIFIFAGIFIDQIKDYLKSPKFLVLFAILLSLPGILAIINLHPYQYVYYNSFTGGSQGAFKQYELDYWATSTKEAMEYINQIAPQDAKVILWGPPNWLAQSYARPDLTITEINEAPKHTWNTFDYQIILIRANNSLSSDNMVLGSTIYQVTIDNAILAKVIQIND